ncbi:contractile injection system tape measure protein [Emticicia sp. 17c]|uniref:contractile injection system tape measure protein n=1 Tax=Emticicia sp. 17c TaxID=3127704 RepID=UPI00301E312D
MLKEQTHNIQSIVFDVTLPRRDDVDDFADAVKSIDVAGIFNTGLAPFNFIPDRLLIDNLTLDLGTITYNDLEAKLREVLSERISHLIAKKPAYYHFYELAKPQELELDALINFLKTGTLHWAFKENHSFDLETIITSLISRQRAVLKQKLLGILPYRVVQERLIRSVSENVFKQIYELFYPTPELALFAELIEACIRHFAVSSLDYVQKKNEILLQNIVSASNNGHKFSAVLVQQLIQRLKDIKTINAAKRDAIRLNLRKLQQKYSNETFLLAEIQALAVQLPLIFNENATSALAFEEKNTKQQKHKDTSLPVSGIGEGLELDPDDLPPAYFIENAGLVIVWYHLRLLFENLGIVKNKKFISPEAQTKALLVLDFIVFGKHEVREHGLALNKILVGMEVEESIELTQQLTDNDIFIIEEFLQKAVIEQWKILKNSSVSWLRQVFLQRKGKLDRTNDGWFLQVEPKGGVDTLLNSLPWHLKFVEFGWMPQKLIIEWKRV